MKRMTDTSAALMMVLESAILEVIINPQSQQQHSSLSAVASTTSSTTTTTIRAFYRDSSGRARAQLRVRLSTPTTHCNHVGDNEDHGGGLSELLKYGCILPAPVDSSLLSVSPNEVEERRSKKIDDTTQQGGEQLLQSSTTTTTNAADYLLSFECALATNDKPNNGCTPASSPSSSSSLPCCWTVEGVTILGCEIERKSSSSTTASSSASSSSVSALLFDIEIDICGNGVGSVQIINIDVDATTEEEVGKEILLEEGILTLCAALRRRQRPKLNHVQQQETSSPSSLLNRDDAGDMVSKILGVFDHDNGRNSNITSSSPSTSSKNAMLCTHIGTRTTPIHIHTTLIPSMQVHVREVCGARSPSGSTLVEITVEHASRWHQENLVVTGISFHPGQSRLLHGVGGAISDNNEYSETITSVKQLGVAPRGKSMQGGELSVIDMSRRVRWGFVPGSAPDMPMTLEPHEAFATVIQIDAGEDVRSRAFVSPISVNATIPSCGERILITTDAQWTSSRVGIENSDAFRVDLSLRGGATTVCRVGAPLVISLRILNLSMEPRDLMLLMAKDDEKRNPYLRWRHQQQPGEDGFGMRSRRRRIARDAVTSGGDSYSQQQGASMQQSSKSSDIFNTAVVSEVNGYTFGVWGLSGEDDGTTRHHRDHELLAVDAALLLGEVKGQHSIQAELRFVPLREGTLDVPNLKLFDKRELKWYNCTHTLKIVATQS